MGIPSSRRTRDRASRGSVDVFSAFERVSAFRRRRSASHSRARSKKLSGFGGSPGSWGPSARSLSSAPSVAAPQRSSTTFRGSARRRPKTPTNGTPPTFRTSRAISLRSHIYARGPCAAAPPETPLRARTRRAGAGERLGSETAGRGLSCRSPPSRSCRTAASPRQLRVCSQRAKPALDGVVRRAFVVYGAVAVVATGGQP